MLCYHGNYIIHHFTCYITYNVHANLEWAERISLQTFKFWLISGLRKHDVAFLITLRPTVQINHKYNHKEPFIPQVGLTFVRGCEIEGMLDEEGKVIEEGTVITHYNHVKS